MKPVTAGHAIGGAIARMQSIDVLRGAVMVLMAIDHVRVYSGIPAGGPSPGIFFTRWVTHFCVPSFVFFAGTSALLYGYKLGSKKKLASYLLTRGLLLVILELTVIRFCWTFNLTYDGFLLAGVIWMLGWCMVLLSAFVSLKPLVVGIIGLVFILAQSLFSFIPDALPLTIRESFGHYWEFIYPSGRDAAWGMSVLYVLVPWIGVMAAGYGFGTIMLMEPVKRKKICLAIGLCSTLAFIVAGTITVLRQPQNPDAPAFIFQLLNQRKYPASLLYLLMTLGPAIALIPYMEKVKGWLARVLIIFGRVPLFYYLLHIPLIHLSSLLANFIKDGAVHPEWWAHAPFTSVPEEARWNLPLLYLVFIIDVTILYFICRWYAKYKFSHPEKKWLKYI